MKYFALCAALFSLNTFTSEKKNCHFSFNNPTNQHLTINYGSNFSYISPMKSGALNTDGVLVGQQESVVVTWNTQGTQTKTPVTFRNTNDITISKALLIKINGQDHFIHSNPT